MVGPGELRQVLEVDLPNDVRSAGVARGHLQAHLPNIPSQVFSDLELLVTELVSNSARHAQLPEGATIHLAVKIGRERVRAEVSDPGPGFSIERARPHSDETGGWGLLLVGEIADSWGVDSANGRSVVWFELECELVS